MGAQRIAFSAGKRSLSMGLDLDPARSNERTIIQSLAAGDFYEPDVAKVMVQVVRPGDVVVDVGANAGFFTTLLATLTGPEGQVLSFEPGDDNLTRLRNNIAINDFSHVSVIERPASDRTGPVQFFLNSDDSGGNALWDVATFEGNTRSAAAPQVMTLQATTVADEILRLNLPAPKLIKVDTEGAELNVLKGCRTFLENRQTPFVIAEVHPFGLEKMGATPQALREFMATFGYESFGLYFDGTLPRLIPRKTGINAPAIFNLLFTTPDDLGDFWPPVFHDPRNSPSSPAAAK
jgi:FkbM family methyltransferase